MPYCLPKWLCHFSFSTAMNGRVPVIPHLCLHLLLSVFWILSILWVCCSISLLVLIFNPLMTYDIEYLFICLFSIIHLLWWRVCSDLLPVFKLDCSFSYYWVWRVLYILWISVLYHLGVLQILFSQCMACLLILLVIHSFI